MHQLQLVSPSPLRHITFLILEQGSSTCLSFRFVWCSFYGPLEGQSWQILILLLSPLLFYRWWVFHTSFSWWFLTEVRLTASFLWSPVSFKDFWRPFQRHQLQLVSPSTSYSAVFSAFWQDPRICFSFRFLKIFTRWSTWTAKSTGWQISFFLLINSRPSFLVGIERSVSISVS